MNRMNKDKIMKINESYFIGRFAMSISKSNHIKWGWRIKGKEE